MRRLPMRGLAWFAGSVLALVLLLTGALLAVGNTGYGRALIETITARLTSDRVRLTGLGGSFPAALDLAALELRDDRGVWLTAEHLSIHWSPLALLARRIEVENLDVARIDIARRPEYAKHSPDDGPVRIPHIDVGQMDVARLELGADLAGFPAALVVRGHGHLRSLADAEATLSAHRLDGVGNYDLQFALTPARIDAMLKLEEPASGPLENLLGWPGLGALAVAATVHGPRANERLEAALSAGALHGSALGSLDLVHPAADLDYTLEAPAMTPRPGVAWEHVSLQGRWHGPLTAPTAEGKLRVAALQLAGGVRLDALAADLTASGGTLAVSGKVDGLTVPGPRPDLLRSSPLALEASIRLDAKERPLELKITHRLATLRAHASFAAGQRATFELQLPELAPFAALGGQEAGGDATLSGQLVRDGSNSPATTEVTLDAHGHIRPGGAFWTRPLAGADRLELAATFGDGAFSLERLTLTARGIALSASGTVTRIAAPGAPQGPRLNGRWELKISDLSVLSSALAGTLDASGKVAGPRQALETDAELKSTLSVRGSPTGKVAASLHAADLLSAVHGTLNVGGELAGAPIDVDLSVEKLRDELFHAVVKHADWRSAHLDGDLVSGPEFKRARGHLGLKVAELRDLQPLLGTTLSGALDGTLTVAPDQRGIELLQLEGRNLTLGSLGAAFRLTGTGPVDAIKLDLDAEAPEVHGAPLTLSAEAILNLGERELRLTSAQATYRKEVARLTSSGLVSFKDGLTLADFRVGAEGAVLAFDGRLLPTLDAEASLHGLQAKVIDALLPGLLSAGTLDADATLRGELGTLNGVAHLQARGLRLSNDVIIGAPPIELQATAQLLDTAAEVDARLEAGASSHVTLTGRAPLAAAGPLDLKLLGQLDLKTLNPLLEAHGRHAAGILSLDATVVGSTADPEIGGTVELAQGDLRDYAQGVHFTEVTAHIEGGHGTLHLTRLSARAAPGTVSMTGSFGILQKGLPLDLTLTARNARPIASNLITADLDADLHLQGKLRERLDLTGTLLSTRTRIEIPDSLPPDVAVLDVRRPGRAAATPNSAKLVIGLDVTVRAPSQVLVSGRGLSAELGGEVHIGGISAAPLVSGGFDLIRGTFALASTQLTFTTGRVSFNGAGLRSKIDPTLDFSAQTTVLDTTATLKITGLADAPQFALTSVPDLPQDEILSRLLFGEAASQLSTLQLAEVGVALTSLSGSNSGLNPLVRIQKTLGLDRLTVGGGTTTTSAGTPINTGATIAAGRYVSKRVYVGAKQSTTGASQLQVEVDLAKHLKLQSQLGNGTAPVQGTTPENDPGSSVGLSYQFEY
jgi:translocation and assembly module TamB